MKKSNYEKSFVEVVYIIQGGIEGTIKYYTDSMLPALTVNDRNKIVLQILEQCHLEIACKKMVGIVNVIRWQGGKIDE